MQHLLKALFSCLMLTALPSCSLVDQGPKCTVQPAPKGTVLLLGATHPTGKVPWTPGMTVRECFMKMGGYTNFTNLRHLRLVTIKRGIWQGQVMQERVINVELGKPDVEIPDQSVIIVQEKRVIF
jgi:hypothetical protein